MSIHSFFERLFTNWQAKLLSFGIAVLLYASFQIISLSTKSFSIPLEVVEGGNFTSLESPLSAVRVTVKGKTEEIAAIQESDITAYIDTSSISKSGTSIVPIKLNLIDDLTLIDPFDIEVSPHTVEMLFEENTFAWIPVEPIFKGLLPDGYEVLSWESTPSDIKITGAKSLVDSITAIYADGVDLREQTDSFTFFVELQNTNNNIRLLAENTASVYVEIGLQIASRIYTDIIPLVTSLSSEFSLANPLPLVTLELSGEKLILENYELAQNSLEVDFTGIREVGEYIIPLRLNIPDAFEQVSITFASVEVEIVSASLDTLENENQAETIEDTTTEDSDNSSVSGDVE